MKEGKQFPNMKRLEDAILEFVERETKEPSSEAAVTILPEMAQLLINMWVNYTGYY